MGALMRRYWHPVAATSELDDYPVKAVRLLGESLVLFRDSSGGFGLLAEACLHRGASLAAGTSEVGGVRCAEHGWLYDRDGRCQDQPLEPDGAHHAAEIRTTAYPVQELGGLLFAYLGPEPRPLLPRYNVLVWNDAVRETNSSLVPCNWLQVMENLLDPIHVEYLHGHYFASVVTRQGPAKLADFMANHFPPPMKKIAFDLFESGIIERHVVRNDDDPSWQMGTASFFPSTSLLGASGKGGSLIFIVPIDDTHTRFLMHMADRTGRPVAQPSIPFHEVPGTDAAGNFLTGTANGQDHMAVVTQGAIARRDVEHLAESDVGLVLYRKLLAEQLMQCENGGDPMNVRRDPADNQVIEIPRGGTAPVTDAQQGWSRQRRRWAARHAPQTPHPAPENHAEPAVLREHREVVIR
jgi:5,5'-dehydrodivanillate O-demethylase